MTGKTDSLVKQNSPPHLTAYREGSVRTGSPVPQLVVHLLAGKSSGHRMMAPNSCESKFIKSFVNSRLYGRKGLIQTFAHGRNELNHKEHGYDVRLFVDD